MPDQQVKNGSPPTNGSADFILPPQLQGIGKALAAESETPFRGSDSGSEDFETSSEIKKKWVEKIAASLCFSLALKYRFTINQQLGVGYGHTTFYKAKDFDVFANPLDI
ncbi:hypothetical protein TWF703_006312 [Orbilia oligospora]|uniref:Uncharacterized protein n=1 Tax=Orbilia oligospora TaxID=2813651 RepID=A0A7C8NK34_ORBOL|nr:hypothetical protein TWF703_006312 [Orbilia oligospora]